MSLRNWATFFVALGVVSTPLTVLSAATYGSVTGGVPNIGDGVQPASTVPGKEYSHDGDHDAMGVADSMQIVAWDGLGGAANGQDFGSEFEIDAIANHMDFLFNEVQGPGDRAHLVFSIDDVSNGYLSNGSPQSVVVSGVGGIPLSGGNSIGGAGELSVELAIGTANPANIQQPWIPRLQINSMAALVDIDGVELWGPEPGFAADTDKYSVVGDLATGTSVYNADGSTYISAADIANPVLGLLGELEGNQILREQIDLDAMMIRDVVGSPMTFDPDPTGGLNGDQIIFSIRQVADPFDPDGYAATGSEIFVLVANTSVSYLNHGGHLWDQAYALGNLDLALNPQTQGKFVVDLNALEAIAESTVVPEPSTYALLGAMMGLVALKRRRDRTLELG